jgi:hypothetical protein
MLTFFRFLFEVVAVCHGDAEYALKLSILVAHSSIGRSLPIFVLHEGELLPEDVALLHIALLREELQFKLLLLSLQAKLAHTLLAIVLPPHIAINITHGQGRS